MATEDYQVGYEAGYQDGWNAAQQPQAEAVPAGYRLVMVPDAAPGDEPDWDECIRQAEVATGIKVERHTISIVIREVRRWLAHRQADKKAPQQAEAVPSSALNPDESDSVTLWAEIWRLREAVKGPDGYATWQDAATAERIRRVRAESKQAEASALIERMADALRSCSGVPHWPSFQPLINEASKWKVEAVPPTHVLVPVELLCRVLDSEEVNAMADASDELRAMIDAAIAQQKGGV